MGARTNEDAAGKPRAAATTAKPSRRRGRSRARVATEPRRLTVDEMIGAMDGGDELRHLRDCPAVEDMPGEPGSRVECFQVKDPDGTLLATVRCVQCGEQVVNEVDT